jgi:two-component system NtrC family sensor kinase
MTLPASLRSLRTELLVKLALLLAAAVLLPVAWVSLPTHGALGKGPLALGVVVAADIVLFVGCAALVLQRAVIQPLREVARAAEDIAAGDLLRRMPNTSSRELHNVAATFDRLTDRVLEDQAQLIRAEKLASIGRLAASVAHEIGNPLGAILGHVHLLRNRLRDTNGPAADAFETLAALERESARIERIVRGLLDYARTRPAAPAPIDIDDVIRSSVELLRSQGMFAAVDVTLETSTEPLFVSGQSHDLEQLFVNLFINAVDAMNGTGRLVVRLERAARFTLREPASRRSAPTAGGAIIEHPPSSRARQWLAGHDAAEIAKIIVADSGPGVAPDLAERIFDPFFTTKPNGKGTGLGLAIVARIVENFHGTVWVTSAREGGAAFHLLFPVVAAPVAANRGTRVPRPRPTPPAARARVSSR